jgi:hypothetical protein
MSRKRSTVGDYVLLAGFGWEGGIASHGTTEIRKDVLNKQQEGV